MSCLRLASLLLALATLVVYLPATRNSFLNYDDGDYVTNNRVVQNGLTWAGIKWAFTTGHASNWHPLTWLSHMTDCELFGLNPAAHHFVNVLFHAINAALVFVLLMRMTQRYWPGIFIAALFAWHPLHVESVAWIAERKDVLSTFFALLALLAYIRYAQGNCRRDFWAALIFFALGLMAKPMLVTLPFVLLLLDYWPLKRVLFPSTLNYQLSTIYEKWPFFLLTAASCVVTYLAQSSGDAVVAFGRISLCFRLENALVAYVSYLKKIFWPANLAVIYPLPDKIPASAVALAAIALTLISTGAWCVRKRSPCLLFGWLWFLGTLVPVVGIVQVGDAALADRYTYFPAIGIFIAGVLGIHELVERFRFPKMALFTLAAVVLAACLVLMERQLSFWRDSETLFKHALAVTGNDNDIAHINLGVAFERQRKFDEALAEYREAVRITPGRYQVHNNLGNILDNLGRPEDALVEYREAVRQNPKLAFLHNSLGGTLAELGRFNEAMTEFTNALRLDPAYAAPHVRLAETLLKRGHDVEAIGHFREALRREPDNFQILAYTAHVLAAIENPEVRDGQTALVLAAKANALTGGAQPFVLDILGMACAEAGRFDEARDVTQRALDLAAAAKMKNLEPLQERLGLYKKNQPWHESFLATNAPPRITPAN